MLGTLIFLLFQIFPKVPAGFIEPVDMEAAGTRTDFPFVEPANERSKGVLSVGFKACYRSLECNCCFHSNMDCLVSPSHWADVGIGDVEAVVGQTAAAWKEETVPPAVCLSSSSLTHDEPGLGERPC